MKSSIGPFISFTIQNVSIKLCQDLTAFQDILDLQYKMFLLNYADDDEFPFS